MTLFLSLPIIFNKLFLTLNSDPDLPMLKTFVESQIIVNTPSFPINFSLSESIFFPIKGSGSHFQSPVCRTFPKGVFILNPFGSRIECVNVIKSISKFSKLIFPLSWTMLR